MLLESRSPDCFSSRYVLKLDGRPVGSFSGRWFDEGMDVRCTGRRNLRFEKVSWLGSHFQLVGRDGTILAQADRNGFLTSSWTLQLDAADAELVSLGFFTTGYAVMAGSRKLAVVDRSSGCDGGWYVRGDESLRAEDLIFVGMIYHTILARRRRRRSNSN